MQVVIAIILALVSSAAVAQSAAQRLQTVSRCVLAEDEVPRGMMLTCENGLYAGFIVRVGDQWGGRLICRRIDTAQCFPDLLITLTKPEAVTLREGDRVACERIFDILTCKPAAFR